MRYTPAEKNNLVVMLLAPVLVSAVMLGCDQQNRKPELTDASKPNESAEVSPNKDDQSPAITPRAFPNTQAESPGLKQFSDSIHFVYDAERDWQKLAEEKILLEASPGTNVRPDLVAFEMTLVPGEAGKDISPFYLSTHEVTAEMFYPWATGIGLGSDDWLQWAKLDLRPSQMDWNTFSYGPPDRPAMGMSRTVAEHYCVWLNRHTGRKYRLPTEAEWDHALRYGGGVPAEEEVLLVQATLYENHQQMLEVPFLELPTPVGQRKPNALGLHDMLGNAAEWVTDTGEERVVRGGHYFLKAKELTTDWRAKEDIEVWNASYPQWPPGVHWYRDFHFTGIRLACDADQAPQTPAEDGSEAP